MGDEGSKAIAAALHQNKILTSLDLCMCYLLYSLGWNGISVEGSKAIAAAIETNCTLTSLALRMQDIL